MLYLYRYYGKLKARPIMAGDKLIINNLEPLDPDMEDLLSPGTRFFIDFVGG
jgi:hypothetical protein